MALQVWLPLNGNLNNQGISGLTFSADSPTVVDSSGKIGSCYKNTSNTSGGIVSGQTINLGSKQSMFCWFKFASLEAQSSLGGGLVSQHRYANNSGMGITIRYVSSTTGYLSVNTGNGSSRTYNTYYGTTLLQANTWYHGGYTYDGSTIRIYVNGVLEKEQGYSGMLVPADYITVFCWSMSSSSGAGIYSDYKFNGSINDVRVYDHCLSPKEVKEISKGLVLHYKLDDPYVEPTTNLITGISYVARCTIEGNGVRVAWNVTSGDTYLFFNTSEEMVQGTTYTLSFDVEGLNESGVSFAWSNITGGDNRYLCVLHNGHNVKTFTHNSSESRTFFDDIHRNNTSNFWMGNFQLEKKDHATPYTSSSRSGVPVYDCSGYGRNGTEINGTLITSSDTSRYENSTKFDGSSTRITVPFNYSYWGNEFTISAWLKSNVNNGGYLTAVGNELSTGGIVFGELTRTNTLQCYLNAASGGADMNICSYTSFTANTWYHLVYTVKNALSTPLASMYVNGNLVMTKDSTSPYGEPDLSVYIGCNRTYRFWNGNLSDFRIYTTALSESDIKDLYQTSAAIHNTGNIEAFEFVETVSNQAAGAEESLIKKVFDKGLSRYAQTNCQVTLTDDGLRIYRPANKTVSGDGNTMWGGLILDNYENRFELQEGHSYLLQFEIKGKTSNPVADVWWSNQAGWGGGGLMPNPTNIVLNNPITGNYNSNEWKTFTYKWTLSDSLYKVCTSSYSIFVEGQTYISYRQFKYGFTYTNTGELGTDLYIKNIRLLDITNPEAPEIKKTGIVSGGHFIEFGDIAEIFEDCMVDNQIIEI